MLLFITKKAHNITSVAEFGFRYYHPYEDDNHYNSGNYVFNTMNEDSIVFPLFHIFNLQVFKGTIF